MSVLGSSRSRRALARVARAASSNGCYTVGAMVGPWFAMLSLVAVASSASADAGAVDASVAGNDAAVAGEASIVDFTDDEGIAGGEEMTAAPPEPLEHESLLPERFRGPAHAPPAPSRTVTPGKRGCGGCAVGDLGGAPGWIALALLALSWAARRRR